MIAKRPTTKLLMVGNGRAMRASTELLVRSGGTKGMREGCEMVDGDKGQVIVPLRGSAFSPTLTTEELATEDYGSILRFRLDIPENGGIRAQDVELRGAPRILGTVFDNDDVDVIGAIGDDKLLHATEVRHWKSGSVACPVDGIETSDSSVCLIEDARVAAIQEATEIRKDRFGRAGKTHALTVINLQLEDPPGSLRFREATLRGNPNVAGSVYLEDKVSIYGEERRGTLIASRIVKSGGILHPEKMHDPRHPVVRTLLMGLAILFIVLFLVIFVAVGLGILGVWEPF